MTKQQMARRTTCILLLVLLVGLGARPSLASPSLHQGQQPPEPTQTTVHVVQRGETLFSIAQSYGSTVDAVAHASGLHDPTRIFVGQQLRIPTAGAAVGLPDTTPYVVQAGDSLISIARRHATSWRDLARINGLISPNVLYAGQVIRIPTVDRAGGFAGRLHEVGEDEVLFQLALRHDVRPWTLVSANRWDNPALIFAGETLLIPGEDGEGLPAPFESIDVRPLPVHQGDSLVIVAHTAEPVTLTGRLFERTLQFSQQDGGYYSLVGVHVFAEPGLYEVILEADRSDGTGTEVAANVVVETGQFGYERIAASPSLLDPDTLAAERERLDGLRATFTSERRWRGPFEPPCDGTVSSYFGTHRAYNEGPYTSYHGGVDLRGSTGTPVHAPAGGTVLLSDELTVRGNAVVLDHGWGVISGFWHLSTREVEVGQQVKQGDLVGRIGSTGLSTGAHLHWEMWVGGVNVDPLQWLSPFYALPEAIEGSDQ